MYLRPPASAPGPGPQGRNRIPSWIEMPQDKPGALEVGVQEGYIFVLLSPEWRIPRYPVHCAFYLEDLYQACGPGRSRSPSSFRPGAVTSPAYLGMRPIRPLLLEDLGRQDLHRLHYCLGRSGSWAHAPHHPGYHPYR